MITFWSAKCSWGPLFREATWAWAGSMSSPLKDHHKESMSAKVMQPRRSHRDPENNTSTPQRERKLWPEDESGWQTELAASQRAAGTPWGSCITSVIHPAIYHADEIRGPPLMWSSARTSVFKRAPNKKFLGLRWDVVPVLIRGLPPAW